MPHHRRISGAPRAVLLVLALTIAAMASLAGSASAVGPGGWERLGHGSTASDPSLNGAVLALQHGGSPGLLYVGGSFTDAGGHASADHIAAWNGTSWSALGTSALNGDVKAIAYAGGKVYAGGSFTNAGGNANADFLAVWNGTTWAPFCNAAGPAFTANVDALQVVGSTLYVGGEFQNGAGIASADHLLACDLNTGASSSTTVDPLHPFSGSVYALTADTNGNVYAGGGFVNLENDPAADNVAYRDDTGWHSMGTGPGACGCAVNTFVRSLAASGTNVFVGTDAKDVAGIAQADNVARWDGSAWHAVGANTAGTDGWFPASTTIDALATFGTSVYATGSFQNAGGDPLADGIARFDGSAWHPVGSNGAGNGPWSGVGAALAVVGGNPVAGGNFTSAGGDTKAAFAALFRTTPTLTVLRSGDGHGSVAGSGIHCPGVCSRSVPNGTLMSLSTTAPYGSAFAGWTGGGCAGMGTCTVRMNTDTTVTARFQVVPTCKLINNLAATSGLPTKVTLSCVSVSASPFDYVVKDGPYNGTLSGPTASGQVTYTPDPGYSGNDFVGYQAINRSGPHVGSQESYLAFKVTPLPQVTRPTESNRVWRVGSGLATLAATHPPVGTTFSFRLNEPARVRLAFTQRARGRKVKGRCAAPTKKNRKKPACKRRVTRGVLAFAGHKGLNKVHFEGRISHSKKLKPGRYTLLITARNAAKRRSAPKALSFRIVR